MELTDKISLKTFWEAVERRLAASSADELAAVLRTLAQETSPSGRQAFLDRLGAVQAGAAGIEQEIEAESLMDDIADLAAEIAEAMEEAPEPEEHYEWGGYDEEEEEDPYTEFTEPLVALFDLAQAAFDNGDMALACDAYAALLELLDQQDDYGRGVDPADLTGVEIAEAQARYLRAVYEAAAPAEKRPEALFDQMLQVRTWVAGARPKLDDLIQISPAPLPDRNRFLTSWIAFLREQPGGDADAWLLAGELETAHAQAAREKELGWSSGENTQGLVVPFFLGLLSGRSFAALPSNLAQLWQWGLQASAGYVTGAGDPVLQHLPRAYAALPTAGLLSREKQAGVLAWCLDVARQRVDSIVVNQHRDSYGKAAVLTAAVAEALRLRVDAGRAGDVLNDVRERFPRHRSFQAELRTAVERSN